MAVDHSAMALGKLPVKKDDRTLLFRRFFPQQLPTPPPTLDLTTGIGGWPMFLNDHLGDCTIATAGHMIQVWTREVEGTAISVSNSDVLNAYEKVSGYDPTTGANNNGAVELDVLNAWRQGQIFPSRPIKAFCSIEPTRIDLVQLAMWLFDGVYIGVELPITARTQDVWDYVPNAGTDNEPGSWGGHAVNGVKYTANGITVPTWEILKPMTWDFWHHYVSECYAVIPTEYDKAKVLSNGFDEAQLVQLLGELQDN